jgi:hypothetical protein
VGAAADIDKMNEAMDEARAAANAGFVAAADYEARHPFREEPPGTSAELRHGPLAETTESEAASGASSELSGDRTGDAKRVRPASALAPLDPGAASPVSRLHVNMARSARPPRPLSPEPQATPRTPVFFSPLPTTPNKSGGLGGGCS